MRVTENVGVQISRRGIHQEGTREGREGEESQDKEIEPILKNDNRSPVAPFRVVNIGNSDKVRLLDFIEAIESELDIKARRNMMPMQMGDVPATWANSDLLHNLTGYQPETSYKEGVRKFIAWYKEYYNV